MHWATAGALGPALVTHWVHYSATSSGTTVGNELGLLLGEALGSTLEMH
jgi:hypothetical protein